ncbi:MAG: DUF1553 domain-containing protein, partial [Verrucomicrobiota bacterium]
RHRGAAALPRAHQLCPRYQQKKKPAQEEAPAARAKSKGKGPAFDPKMAWIVGAPLAMGMTDREDPSDVPLLIGGEPDKPDKIIPRGFPKVMDYPGAKPFSTEGSGRLELAEWMTHPNHPLTSRVMVNRVWGHLFGRGIVGTVDNFGTTGAKPTHPELLDFLAIQFTKADWSVKRLIRAIVLSRAYRQSSANQAVAEKLDPENEFLWRMSPKRLEAEAIRDSLLTISGQVQAPPFTSPVAFANSIGSQGREARMSDHGFDFDQFFGRTIYAPVLRRDLPTMLELFDFPDPNILVGNRTPTTSPTQALYLMNHLLVDELSSRTASRLALSSSDRSGSLEKVYLSCVGRLPDAIETKMALDYLQAYQRDLGADEDGAWSSFIKQLISSAEFRHLY